MCQMLVRDVHQNSTRCQSRARNMGNLSSMDGWIEGLMDRRIDGWMGAEV